MQMKTIANVILVLISLACLAALAASVYPGLLNDIAFAGLLLSFLVVPPLGAILLIVLVVVWRRGKLSGLKAPWTHAAIASALLFFTFCLLKFYIPRRIAFAAARSEFEQFVPEAPKSEQSGAPLNRRLGVYLVDEYAADPRGGVYFRVHSGADGIGPDTMSSGFAYQPNAAGTPFGAASYQFRRLGHSWYWFRASDDWH
jgi:hypothetical protein